MVQRGLHLHIIGLSELGWAMLMPPSLEHEDLKKKKNKGGGAP